MSELTDLEICDQLAKIKGFEPVHTMDIVPDNDFKYIEIPTNLYHYFPNPLTDDALCFKLMVEFGVALEPCGVYENMFLAYGLNSDGFKVLPKIHNHSPNRAICLAIIELHKGK